MAAGDHTGQSGPVPLFVESLAKSFGGLQVLTGVDFSVVPNEVCGLIGPNGAGKSTLFDIISGHGTADAGSVSFFGQPTGGQRPHVLARQGLARSFQAPRAVEDQSMLENAIVGARYCDVDMDWAKDRAQDLLARLGVPADDWTKRPAEVTPPVRRIMQIVRTITMRPRLILLDEPMAGLDGGQIANVCELLREIAIEESSVLLVEHRIDAIMSAADRVLVLAGGEIIFDGEPKSARQDTGVQNAYFGSTG